MLTTIDTENAICNYLNEFLFDNVWNLPQAEYRQNIVMRCIASSPKVNRVDLGLTSILLPDSNPYFIYAVPKTYLEGIKVDVPTWTNLLDFVNDRPIDFRITGVHGEWLYRKLIYIINHPCEDSFILAINYHMANKILNSDKKYNFKKMYFSVYYDSDRGNSVYYDCIRPLNLSQRNIAWDKCQLAQITLINGREAVPTSVADINTGDYIEFIDDPDTIADFTIDMTDPDQNRIFKSSISPEFKYIIHIPKEYNPNNYLITHNTCDVFVRPKNITNHHLKGVFIHRFNTENTITQITHNDFAIAESLIQSYMSFIGSTEVELRVIVRCHEKKVKLIDQTDIGESILVYDVVNGIQTVVLNENNIGQYINTQQMMYNHPRKLIREANYIDMLYQLSDYEILDFLEGNGPHNLSFWRAANLEASKYLTMMFYNPIYVNRNNMDEYVPLLSYYNTMSVLCGRVTRTTLSRDNIHTFTVLVPIIMMNSKKLFVNVFVNGIKLDYSKYTFARFSQFMEITVDEDVDLPAGVEIVTELFEKPVCYGDYFIPTQENLEFNVTDEFLVFLVNELGADDSVIRNDNYFTKQYNLDMSYKDVTGKEEYYTTNGKHLIFAPDSAGKTFFMCSKSTFANPYNLSFDIADLHNNSITSGVLYQDYQSWGGESTMRLPVLQDVSPVVFLNGRELVKDVDFSFNTNKDLNGNVTCKTVHVTNVEYLATLKKSIVDYLIVTKCGSANVKGQYKFVEGEGLTCKWTNQATGISVYYNTDLSKWVFGDDKSVNTGYFYESEVTTSTDPSACNWTVGSRGKPVVPDITKYYETYTNRDNNYLEVLVTTDKCFAEENGFIINKSCNSLNILMFWYPGLAMFTADGKAIKNIAFKNGYLYLDPSEVRNGAIYNMRAMAPDTVKETLDNYADSSEDLIRCAYIIDFFRNRLVEEDNYTIIPNSHHIYSIVMNEVIKDVLAGRLNLTYDADIEKMKIQIQEYLTIKDQDPAIKGSIGTLTVYKATNSLVNAVYKIMDETSVGKTRVWLSSNSVVQLKWANGMWMLRSIYRNIVEPYYYAVDPDGDHDPWTLTWSSYVESETPPSIYSGNLNLKFIDILPSYKVSEIYDAGLYKLIKHLANAILPADAVKDVINAQS